jgi:hypothetical protein
MFNSNKPTSISVVHFSIQFSSNKFSKSFLPTETYNRGFMVFMLCRVGMSVFSHISLNTQNIKKRFKFWTPDYNCCYLMADLRFIPLIVWHPNTTLIVLWRYGPVLGTVGGDLCPLLCSSVCRLCSSYGWWVWCDRGMLRDSHDLCWAGNLHLLVFWVCFCCFPTWI